MKNRLISSLETMMAAFDMSLTGMNTLTSGNPYGDIGKILWKTLFSKTDQEICAEMVAIKDAVFNTVYQIDFCPFERLTGVSWEAMLNACHIKHDAFKYGGMKLLNPWMHIMTSSALYIDALFEDPQKLFFMRFEHTGQEFISLDDTLYMYGEGKIVADRAFDFNRCTPHMRTIQPTIIIDDRLLSELVMQKEWGEVLEIIYTLYHLSSHDGMIHSLFIETDQHIRAMAQADPIMKKLTEVRYYCYDMYEMNYARMMRAAFDLGCQSNPSLRDELDKLWTETQWLTRTWPTTLQQYVRFIATERVSRLMQFPYKMFYANRYLGGVEAKDGSMPMTKIDNFFLYDIIHMFPEKEALVHNGDYYEDMDEISYADMTNFMMNCYLQTV